MSNYRLYVKSPALAIIVGGAFYLTVADGKAQVDPTINRTSPLYDTSASTPPPKVSEGSDASDHPKFYTLTAALREEYDDNIYTSKNNAQSSFKTDFSPSILVDF